MMYLDWTASGGILKWDTSNPGSDRFTYTNNDRTATFGNGPAHGVTSCIGTASRSAGKYVVEIIMNVPATYGNGVRQDCGLSQNQPIGFGGSGLSGVESFGYRFSGDGRLLKNSTLVSTYGLLSKSTDHVIMWAVDFNAGKAWFGVDGTYTTPGVGTVDPSTGNNPAITFTANTQMWPFASYEDGTQTTVTKIRGQADNLTYSLPSGFSAWS